MRTAIAVLATVLLTQGDALGGEGGSWFWFLHPRVSGEWAQPGTGCCGDSVLCPEFAPWVLQPSHCRQPWPSFGHAPRSACPDSSCGVVAFPPLPYGNRPPVTSAPQPQPPVLGDAAPR
jgi:hypothetical protein